MRETFQIARICALCAGLCLLAMARVPEASTAVKPEQAKGPQAQRWAVAKINAKDSIRLDKAVVLYRRNQRVYAGIEGMRKNGVPATVLFGLHYRESDNDFTANPAQGDPLTHRSVHVPKGRIPGVPPPYTFAQAAEDAYYVVDRLDLRDWRHLESALDAVENFNGPGYRNRGVPSPYVWAGTNIYQRGKFVADGRYSPTALDAQLGVAAILMRMNERGIALPFPE